MHRMKLIPVFLACFCTLTACSKSDDEMQRALDFRTSLLSASSCTFTTEVTADFGQRVYEFTLDCAYHSEDNYADLRVTAPDTIAGIAASVDGEDAEVKFENVSLELGTMAGGHVAPMQLPQILGDAWTYGYVDSIGKAGDGYLVTYRTGYDSDELLIYTYFDTQMVPIRSEVYYEETCVLAADIENFAAA